MHIPFDKYCGDAKMEEYLKKVGSKITLSEIHGLFYGCIAASHIVKFSQYFTIIFGEEEPEFKSTEETKDIIGNLMSLWNILAGCKLESEPLLYPDIEYPDTVVGLKQRVKDDSSLIEYFIKGLDLGGTKETDFSEDGIKALKFLSESNAFLIKYTELFEIDDAKDKVPEKTTDLIDQLEDVVADCIARINIGLKEARLRAVEEMRKFADVQIDAHQTRSTKIPRNEPCPCGSGKKYKKCCGLLH